MKKSNRNLNLNNVVGPGTYKFKSNNRFMIIPIIILDLTLALFITMLFLEHYIVYTIIVTLVWFVFNFNMINSLFFTIETTKNFFTYKSPFLSQRVEYKK